MCPRSGTHYGTQKIILDLNDQESLHTFFDMTFKLGLYTESKSVCKVLLKNSKHELIFVKQAKTLYTTKMCTYTWNMYLYKCVCMEAI